MEEIKRVSTKKKTNTGTIILIVLASLLGLGLIGAAVYFYAMESPEEKKKTQTETTCACYYIDPSVVSECGDQRRGFLFETATVSGDQVCRAACSTSNLSVNLLNSNTRQELYQICQLQTLTDTRCTEMIVKNKNGKIVTGKVPADEELTITATFDQQYSDYKIIVNNQDYTSDETSADGLTITKKISNLDSNTINIAAVATSQNGEQVGSPLCRRLIEVDRETLSDVTDLNVETRVVDNVDKISRIRIGVGNISEEDSLTLKFSFKQKDLNELVMNEGFTLDPAKGEITIIEQDLYNSDNFGTETSFAQLDKIEGTVEMTVTVNSDSQIIGSATQSFTLQKGKEISEEEKATETQESNFSVSKTSSKECVERIAPNNTTVFTVKVTNNSSIPQRIKSIKDKLPLGFTYTKNSSRINTNSANDNDLVSTTDVGQSQEIIWQKEGGWNINPGEHLTIEFQSQVGENALSGQNQNEVIITPEEVPADPTTLRAEYVILVAQDCSDPDAIPEEPKPQEPTTKDPSEKAPEGKDPVTQTESTTTPETGIFESTVARVIIGLIVLVIGWYIYSKPLGQSMTEKLIGSKLFKEAEVSSWKIFNPKKYFENKVIKDLTKKKK